MPTDIPTILARLQDEKTAIEAQLAAVDRPAEKDRFDTAEADWAEAGRVHRNKTQRWNFIGGIEARLAAVEKEIALLTP